MLLILLWPQEFKASYNSSGWYVQWRAFFCKVHFSDKGFHLWLIGYHLVKGESGDRPTDSSGEADHQKNEEFKETVATSENVSTESADFEQSDNSSENENSEAVTFSSAHVNEEHEYHKKVLDTIEPEKSEQELERDEALIHSNGEDIEAQTDLLKQEEHKKPESSSKNFYAGPIDSSEETGEYEEESEKKQGFSIQSIKEKIDEYKGLWELHKKDIKRVFRWIKRILKYSLKIIKPNRFHVSIYGGLDNPAYTGRIYAWFTNTFAFLPTYEWFFVRFVPQYGAEKKWDADAEIVYRFALIQLLLIFLLILLTIPLFPALRLRKAFFRNDKTKEEADSVEAFAA